MVDSRRLREFSVAHLKRYSACAPLAGYRLRGCWRLKKLLEFPAMSCGQTFTQLRKLRRPEMEKRTAQIVAHVSEETAALFRAMAEIEQTTVSEKSGELITGYLEIERVRHERMCRVFRSEQNDE